MIIELPENGVTIFEKPDSHEEILSFARRIGKVLPGDNGGLIQEIKAKHKGQGIVGSFSYNVGLNEFPWHTDTAYWDSPVRWLLLFADTPNDCTTNYLRLDDLFAYNADYKLLARKALFLRKLPGSVSVVSFLFKFNDTEGYRYDQNIMVPYNSEAFKLDKLIRDYISSSDWERIQWTGKNMALIDNWKGIHNRSDCHACPGRKIYRLYIEMI